LDPFVATDHKAHDLRANPLRAAPQTLVYGYFLREHRDHLSPFIGGFCSIAAWAFKSATSPVEQLPPNSVCAISAAET
jgi:hypothetical protein